MLGSACAKLRRRGARLGMMSLVLGCFSLASPTLARADERLPLAEEFFNEGDYFRAITEFRRMMYDSTDDAEVLRLWLRITVAYVGAGRYTEALQSVQKAERLAHTKDEQARVCFMNGRVYTVAGVFMLARKQFEKCMADRDQLAFLGPDRMRLAIAATYFEKGDWDETRKQLGDVQAGSAGGSFRREAAAMHQASLDASHIPYRSPAVAGLLSAIVPGLGQTYEGRYWDGLQSLVIVGSLGVVTGALLLSDSHRHGVGLVLPIVVGSIGGVFYLSNVYGAVNGARMSNLLRVASYIDEEKPKYRSVWEIP